MNVARPSIHRDLGFSGQNLQWVLDITVGHDRIPVAELTD
jgi:hypothetical protein